jgi:hypothetical protein
VTPCPKGPLEVAHVGILFGIDLRIGKENGQVANESVRGKEVQECEYLLDVEFHDGRGVQFLDSYQWSSLMSSCSNIVAITAL